MTKIPLSIYIHFPWCLNKCPYCDFNSYSISCGVDLNQYVDKLLLDIELEAAKNEGRRLSSIYFGGGTPSLLAPEMVAKIIEKVKSCFLVKHDIEVSLEANPGTIEEDSCISLKQAGINRLSIGVQSFNDDQLKKIGRAHNSFDAIKAIESVKAAEFDNFNIDLMFGLPEQNVEKALQDLEKALDFCPRHLSWYQLTLEKGISFDQMPKTDEIWDIQQAGQDFLQKQRINQYEISAYAKSLKDQCQHNINYWQYGDYIGVGAGAHGKLTKKDHTVKRYVKISDPFKYIKSNEFIESEELVSKEKIPLEFMLNALRLNQPISFDLFLNRTGFTIDTIKEKLLKAQNLRLLDLKENFIVTTTKGRNFLDNLLELFL